MPVGVALDEKQARYSMLERLADYDDELMEQLIGDIEPPRDRVFDDLARELREGHVVPLLMGSATGGHGVTRLLKALRHEAPGVAQTRQRLGIEAQGPSLAQCVRTVHTAHGGKLSLARVLRGAFPDGATVTSSSGGEDRIAGLMRLMGATFVETFARRGRRHGRVPAAGERRDRRSLRRRQDGARRRRETPPPAPTQSVAVHVRDRKDEVRLAAALAKLTEEDSSLAYVHEPESGELKLFGQGEMHLRVTGERLADRFGVAVDTKKPSVAYRETIREAVTVRGRHKKQSGGHGQYGDVLVEVAPRGRGEGFASPRKCMAARCRSNISRPWKWARATRWRAGRSAFPSSTSRSRCWTAPTMRSIPPTWRFAPPPSSRSPKRCRRRARCCWSRSSRSPSTCPRTRWRARARWSARGAGRFSASRGARAGRAGTPCAR